MTWSRFGEEQALATLKEREVGMPMVEVRRPPRDQLGGLLKMEVQVWLLALSWCFGALRSLDPLLAELRGQACEQAMVDECV